MAFFLEFQTRNTRKLSLDIDEDPIVGVVQTQGGCILTMKSGRKEELDETYDSVMDKLCPKEEGEADVTS